MIGLSLGAALYTTSAWKGIEFVTRSFWNSSQRWIFIVKTITTGSTVVHICLQGRVLNRWTFVLRNFPRLEIEPVVLPSIVLSI